VGHPWELTLRQFVEKVRQDYGMEIDVVSLPVPGSLLSDGLRAYALPFLEEDDLLDPLIIESICRVFELPPADFHLDPSRDD
jgi:hypothetical protein